MVWICHFYDLISRLLLSFNFDRGDISKTRECFITFNSEHLEFHPKFSAAAAFFNSLLGVWKCDETLSRVQYLKLLFNFEQNEIDVLSAVVSKAFICH